MQIKFLLVSLAYYATMAHAWCFKVWDENNYQGHNNAHNSIKGPSECINFPEPISGNIHSLIFKPAAGLCKYEIYGESGCKGDKLVSQGGNVNISNVQEPSNTAKSFKISGGGCYRTLPIALDCDP